MRKSPLTYRSDYGSAARLAGLLLFSILLLVPVSLFATVTRATVTRATVTRQRARRLRASSSRTHLSRVHASRAHSGRIHAVAQTRPSRPYRSSSYRSSSYRSRQQSARLRRVAVLHRRRYGRRARARRYRVEATLDNVRTHTPLGETPAANTEEFAAAGQVEKASPLTLTSASAPPAPATPSRDLPFFSPAVPQFMPAALRGSHDVLVHQNIVADVEGLTRIQNDFQLNAMVHSGDLVALPASSALAVDYRLPLNRRYCRPWTAKFLSDLSRAHESVFGHPLQLTSAVRTVDFQRHLAHYNGNAAPAYGDTASPHLTGQAIDLGKKGMSMREIAWMRAVLGQLQAAGKLDVEEEFEQACFHISVYKTYAPHTTLPSTLVAANVPAPEEVQTEEAPATAIGQLRPVSEPVARRTWSHRRSYSTHPWRRAAVRRRRRRHHASMSLIAAGMR